MTSIAFVFPGQGSQMVGMGADAAAAYAPARDTFAEADDALGFPLSKLCFEGPEADLNLTLNTQPALFVCGIALMRALAELHPGVRPVALAGHSLGELTALTTAGALSFTDGVRLVRERGRLMTAAGDARPGAMAAVLGLDADAVRAVCAQAAQETGGVVVLANDNCPGQIVISGEYAALDHALVLAKAAGAKRAVKLAVSIAAHSPLMEAAAEGFRAVLAATPFSTPSVPVYGNVDAAPLGDADAIRRELEDQLMRSVRWTDSVRAMRAAGITHFIELAPKDVLTGLLKRIDASASGVTLHNADALVAYIA